eukprot:3812169-Rhodomonas_salina.2
MPACSRHSRYHRPELASRALSRNARVNRRARFNRRVLTVRVVCSQEQEVELQDALSIKKVADRLADSCTAEIERLERELSKVQAQKRADKKLAAQEAGLGDSKAHQVPLNLPTRAAVCVEAVLTHRVLLQRLKQSAFDPNTTASLSTAAAMGKPPTLCYGMPGTHVP